MMNIFRVLGNRLAAMFATHVALDFEKQFLSLQSDRKAELLLKADELEERGLGGLAVELREQAASLSLEAPLASANTAFGEFSDDPAGIVAVAEPLRIATKLQKKSKPQKKTTTRKTSRKRKVATRR
jgi:hypothetical protein